MIAYVDSVGGVAGDMLLAALLDAGASEAVLRELPSRLGLADVELRLEPVERHGIGALHLDVVPPRPAPVLNSWSAIERQLSEADLTAAVRARAVAVFKRLVEAESRVHRVALRDVHFHELGAVDTLIDVVGVVTLLADLGVERLVCSPLPLGRGTIDAAHGVLPLPAPATTALLDGVPVYGVDLELETVTPTGAALLSTLADAWGALPLMTLGRVGCGAGTADPAARPNIVRVLLGDPAGATGVDSPGTVGEAVLLETNLDDMLPELIPDALVQCFAAGALDVWTAPVTMKKGRPGLVFSALARPRAEGDVARAMLLHTSALGVRVSRLRRYELAREEAIVEVEGHAVRVKLGRLDERTVNIAPEHDDCLAVATATSTPVKSVWAAALAAARKLP